MICSNYCILSAEFMRTSIQDTGDTDAIILLESKARATSLTNGIDVYDLSHLISTSYFRTYAGLTKIQRIEWNNRGMSIAHAIFISTMSLYFVFWSDLYSDHLLDGIITFRSSQLSFFALGVGRG